MLCLKSFSDPDGFIVAKTWRQIGSTLFQHARQLFPLLVSVVLISWVIWSVTPQRLARALMSVNWPWLVLATLVQVVVLFLWDTFSLWWLFSQPKRRLPFRLVLRARADTLLWSAINLEIGQGVFAWKLAQALRSSVMCALGRCFLLALFDLGTLLSLGLVGSFLKPSALIQPLRWICAGGLLGLLGVVLVEKLLSTRWRAWLAGKDWAAWIKWWTWRRSLLLGAQRLILFLLVMLYAWVSLSICGIPVDARTIFGVMPFVFLAESLPGTGGLGEREMALYYLLGGRPEERAVVVSFGLIWSTVVILSRVAIGLISSWLPRADQPAAQTSSHAAPTEVDLGAATVGTGSSAPGQQDPGGS